MKRIFFALMILACVAGCATTSTTTSSPLVEMKYTFGPQQLFESYDFYNHIYSTSAGLRVNTRENRVVSFKPVSTTPTGETNLIIRMPRLEIAQVVDKEMKGSALAVSGKGVLKYSDDPGISKNELKERTDRVYKLTMNPKGEILALSTDDGKAKDAKAVLELIGNPFMSAFALYGFESPDFPLTRGVAWKGQTKFFFPKAKQWVEFETQLQVTASGENSFQVIVFGTPKPIDGTSFKLLTGRMYAKYVFDALEGFIVSTQQEYELEYKTGESGRYKEEIKYTSNNTRTK